MVAGMLWRFLELLPVPPAMNHDPVSPIPAYIPDSHGSGIQSALIISIPWDAFLPLYIT